MSKRVEFSEGITQAGTQIGSEDANLAFEIFGKVKLLERFRSAPTEQATRSESPQLKERRQKLRNLLAKSERLAAAKSSTGFDMDAARRRNEKFIDEVRADFNRLESEQDKSRLDTRVTYEETSQIIEIFKNAPQVKVVVTSLGVRAGEEFRTVMEQAAWFCKALQDVGVNVESRFWETLRSLPDGTNIW